MEEISLFEKQLKRIRKKQKVKNLSYRVMLTAVLVLAVAMIGLSSWSLALVKSNQKLSEKINQTKQQIEGLRSLESKQVYLTSKLGSFSKVLKTQEAHQAVAETIFALLPDRTSLKGFEVTDENLINLSGSLTDYLSLMELINNVKQPYQALKLPVIEAKMKQVSVGKDSQINFSLELIIGGLNKS